MFSNANKDIIIKMAHFVFLTFRWSCLNQTDTLDKSCCSDFFFSLQHLGVQFSGLVNINEQQREKVASLINARTLQFPCFGDVLILCTHQYLLEGHCRKSGEKAIFTTLFQRASLQN